MERTDRVIEEAQKPTDGKMTVGVYGSLRKGHYNHGILDGATYLGTVSLSGFQMYDLGAFPGACYGPEGDTIIVELYDVDQDIMNRLDLLEGHPDFYRRQKIQGVPLARRAWVYLLPKETLSKHQMVEQGDWNEYRENIA